MEMIVVFVKLNTVWIILIQVCLNSFVVCLKSPYEYTYPLESESSGANHEQNLIDPEEQSIVYYCICLEKDGV